MRSSRPFLLTDKMGTFPPSPAPCQHPSFYSLVFDQSKKDVYVLNQVNVNSHQIHRGKIFSQSNFTKNEDSQRTKYTYCCLVAKSYPTLSPPWTVAHQTSLSLTISWSWPKFMSIGSVMLSNLLILCHPLLLLPSVFPSIRVFFSESAVHIGWPNCWSFSFSISPFDEYSGLI